MKKISLILKVVILIFAGSNLTAQNEADALRYSFLMQGGTTRYMSMGSAFGALGADMSVMGTNPAALAIYRSSEFAFSPSFYFDKINSKISNDQSFDDFNYNLNLNNMGMVLAFSSDKTEGWVSSAFGFNYNRYNNYGMNFYAEGINDSNSISDYFAKMGYGYASNALSQFSEGLAYQGYLIDPNTSGVGYHSAYDTYGEKQEYMFSSKGYLSEYEFAYAANYANKLYLGGTFGIQDIKYIQKIDIQEKDVDQKITDFNSMDYYQYLKTKGIGYNFKFGMLFRPIDWVRFGFAVHTPTFMNLHDNYYSTLKTSFNDSTKSYDGSSPDGTYDYGLITPFRTIGSVAFVIKKQALVSFEGEMVDYSLARLRASDYGFVNENEAINRNYVSTFNLRGGLEYRYDIFNFRAGFGYYGSPYNSQSINKNSYTLVYSGGLGIRENGYFFSVGYSMMQNEFSHYMYDQNVVATAPVNNKRTSSQLMFTFGFKF
ncbi:MAG: hypothetical protein J7L46_02945 [Bacteroidales bacterium]|nr:hypothetical protein [Bacteroidales bacterium]